MGCMNDNGTINQSVGFIVVSEWGGSREESVAKPRLQEGFSISRRCRMVRAAGVLYRI